MSISTTSVDFAARTAPNPIQFRIIPRIETYPAVASFAQTIAGKVCLLALFGFGLKFMQPEWKVMTLWLALITFLPKRRRLLVTLGMLQWTILLPLEKAQFSMVLLSPMIVKACVCAMGGILFWCAVRFERSVLAQRPVFVLLTGFAAFVYFATILQSYYPQLSVLLRFATVVPFYLWFIAYALVDARSKDRDPFGLQLGTFHPFWGSTETPFPKGAAYLRRIEARSPEQLAIVQLKALKLLAWAIILSRTLVAFQWMCQRLPFPSYERAFENSVHGTPDPWFACWASLIVSFLQAVLTLSVSGHLIIACCRMAGFAALRNTYRPFESRTIAEFWNRYYFYFKELLVDLFFYPTFMRYFKRWPKIRLLAATLAAAAFGNAYYHFFSDMAPILKLGFWKAIVAYQPYLFYCLVLGVGIGASQLRKRKPAPAGWVRQRLVPSFTVTLFFCLLHIFGDTSRTYPIREHFRFFLHLFTFIS